MRRVWLIRPGAGSAAIDPMRHAGLIGVGYDMVGDARSLAPAEIEKLISDRQGPSGLTGLRVALTTFVNDARVGDLVVTPNVPRSEVWLGVITGSYEYTAEARVAGYQHIRTVDWLGWLDRDAPRMRDQLKSIERPLVMVELPGREWWLKFIDSNELTPQPRSISAPVAGAARTPRARKQAAPSAPKRKPPAALVRCAGDCGYSWPPTSLVDGLCADCRAD